MPRLILAGAMARAHSTISKLADARLAKDLVPTGQVRRGPPQSALVLRDLATATPGRNGRRGVPNWSGGQVSPVGSPFPSSPRAFEFYPTISQASGNAFRAARYCPIVRFRPHKS